LARGGHVGQEERFDDKGIVQSSQVSQLGGARTVTVASTDMPGPGNRES
jgi:hypothetical protein